MVDRSLKILRFYFTDVLYVLTLDTVSRTENVFALTKLLHGTAPKRKNKVMRFDLFFFSH